MNTMKMKEWLKNRKLHLLVFRQINKGNDRKETLKKSWHLLLKFNLLSLNVSASLNFRRMNWEFRGFIDYSFYNDKISLDSFLLWITL